MSAQRLINAVNAYLQSVNSRLGGSVVHEKFTLASSATKTYNLASLFGSASEWELLTCRISVLVHDSESGSPTVNKYVNAESIISIGNNDAGEVTLYNHHTGTVSLAVTIEPPTRKKVV